MKKIFSIFIVLVIVAISFTGCSRSHAEEIQSLIDELESKIETLSVDAEITHKKGVIADDLYYQVETLKMKFNENKELFESTTGRKDRNILKALKECKETVDEIQQQIDSVYENYDEVRNYSFELLNDARILSEYMETGLAKGYIDQAAMDEFNSIYDRLAQITENQFPDDVVKAELDSLKERLTVMSSQCAAPNEVVDSFVTAGNSIEEAEGETEDADTESSSKVDGNNDIQTVIDNFTLLQNEASQNVDRGVISEEQYMTIIQSGTKLAELKENIDNNGESDFTAKELEKCRKEIYDIAAEINSPLAEKFK